MARPEAPKRPRDARKRQIGSDADAHHRRLSPADGGGLVGAVLRRQATGGKGIRNQAFVLGATGGFHKRLRKQLEGVPEMIADVKKSLASGTLLVEFCDCCRGVFGGYYFCLGASIVLVCPGTY